MSLTARAATGPGGALLTRAILLLLACLGLFGERAQATSWRGQTGLDGSCSGVLATTSTHEDGWILYTAVYVRTGPVGAKEFFEFFDENLDAMNGLTTFHSEAGCQDCMIGFNVYDKQATSEHFWQNMHDSETAPSHYCPGAWGYGQFMGYYCEANYRTFPGCTSM